MGRVNLVIAVVAGYVTFLIWRRYRAARKKTKSIAGEQEKSRSEERERD